MPQQRLFGKKQIKALYATYGEHDLYNSGNFNPKTRNLTTGATHRSHHCARCKRARTKACFENLHHAFCAEYVTRNGRRERCGKCFALESDGCGTHRRVHGFNSALYRAFDGEDVQLDDFDDTDQKKVGVAQVGNGHDKAAELAIVNAAAEAHIAIYGHLPATFYRDYFDQRAKEMSCAQGEQSLVRPAGLTESQVLSRDKHRHFAAAQVTSTLDVSAVKPKTKNLHAVKKSFAPKGAKPQMPTEAPRRSEDEEEVAKGPKKISRTFVGKVFDELNGVPK